MYCHGLMLAFAGQDPTTTGLYLKVYALLSPVILIFVVSVDLLC